MALPSEWRKRSFITQRIGWNRYILHSAAKNNYPWRIFIIFCGFRKKLLRVRVKRDDASRAHVYEAAVSEGRGRKSVLSELKRRFYGGSSLALVRAMWKTATFPQVKWRSCRSWSSMHKNPRTIRHECFTFLNVARCIACFIPLQAKFYNGKDMWSNSSVWNRQTVIPIQLDQKRWSGKSQPFDLYHREELIVTNVSSRKTF